jgi:SAM-dependent methyltransferase
MQDPHDVHALAIAAVPVGSRVLDVGCADGSLSQHLAARGAFVVGVDFDKEALRVAEATLASVSHIDLEHDLDQQLIELIARHGGTKFDCILAMDVLEHVRNPSAVLRSLVTFCLADHGRLILSLPNIAHGSVRLALLEGKFEYQPTGLLDETHLRFFTQTSVDALLAECDLTSIIEVAVGRDILATEVAVNADSISPDVLVDIRRDPHAYTYQFFRVATRKGLALPGQMELYNLVRSSNEVAEQQQHRQQIESLEATIAELRSRLTSQSQQLQGALADTSEAKLVSEQTKAHLELVYKSHTWKIGSLLLRPLRLAKRQK